MNSYLKKVLLYFTRFEYAATLEELYTFFPESVSWRRLRNMIDDEVKNKHLKNLDFHDSILRYTLPQYSNKTSKFRRKLRISEYKIRRLLPYVRMLASFPQIKLVGLSGSVSMLNAEKNHDVDLFVITAGNRLFTGRFIALLLAEIMNIRRRRASRGSQAKDSVCLNLFFDESQLQIPRKKRSEYVAHEVLQMKPLEQKGDIYSRFIDINRWVFDIFPNAQKLERYRVAKKINRSKNVNSLGIADLIEALLKKVQLFLISRHRTTELVTDTQLWFHPDDFEKKLRSH